MYLKPTWHLYKEFTTYQDRLSEHQFTTDKNMAPQLAWIGLGNMGRVSGLQSNQMDPSTPSSMFNFDIKT